MTQGRIRGLALITTGVALSFVLIILTNSGPILADVPWPTPTPGPEPPISKLIDVSEIKPVVVPGATSWVIPPLSMPVPRFPPVPAFPVEAPDGVRVISDAGSINSTVQLVYESLAADEAPPAPSGLELRTAFDLRAFDHRAKPITLGLLRPWVLEIPIQLAKSFEDPDRLLIARYTEDQGWAPLVTHFHRKRGILQARVLEAGLFAILAEPRVILG